MSCSQLSRPFLRMASSLVGRSGRLYTRKKILQKHLKNPDCDIWLATTSDHQRFVLKSTSSSVFDLAQDLRRNFGDEERLRNHVDDNTSEHTLVYEYFQGDLLNLVKFNADIPLKPRKFILRQIGLAIKALHSKDYVHLDLKPDNVMLNWIADSHGDFKPTRVVLADLDCAYKIENQELLDLKMGNVMWRSPEGQAAKGIGKASEVFSFGLMCLFTITGAECFHPDFAQVKADGIEPEHVIIYKLLQTFGPAPPGLVAHIHGDELWTELLTELSEVVVEEEDQSDRFQNWDESAFPNLTTNTKRLILRMTNLDPKERATIDQVMDDPWWDEV